MITIEIDDESIRRQLQKLADAAVDPSDALDAIGYKLVESRQRFPTPVGMNRKMASAQLDWSTVPHARGDEPATHIVDHPVSPRSPRPWG